MSRAETYQAIEKSRRVIKPESTPSERAQLGADACLLALAMTAGTEVASRSAYEMADGLATGGRVAAGLSG
jgi:hypothetical protein